MKRQQYLGIGDSLLCRCFKLLRRVLIYRIENDKEEQIFDHTFARSFDSEQFSVVLQRMKGLFLGLMEGKPASRPFFTYQIHYMVSKSIYFIFITDNADRPRAIAKELESTVKMYHKLFADPKNPSENKDKIDEFRQFLQETHTLLHPKIALIGPMGAGKTTICNSFDIEVETTKIMNFGEIFQVKIQGLYFDLWDYILPDDFSPLVAKVSAGADLILVVLNAADINDKKDMHFISSARREEKYSRVAYIITHNDDPNAKMVEHIKDLYKLENNVFLMDPSEETANITIERIISEVLDLKQPLPAEFRMYLVSANKAVESQEYGNAIELLNKALKLCVEYQDLTYVPTLEEKISELTIKKKEKEEQEQIEKNKITAPTMRKIGGAIKIASLKGGVKTLGGSQASTDQQPELPTVSPLKTQSEGEPVTKPVPTQSTNPFFSQSAVPTIGVPQNEAAETPKMSSSNPFFSQSALPDGTTPKYVEINVKKEPVETVSAGVDGEGSEPRVKPLMPKVKPLDLSKFEPKQAKSFEIENSEIIKTGISADKTLTLEKSPLRKDDFMVKPQIEKSDEPEPERKTKLEVPDVLASFDPLKSKVKKEVVSNKTMQFAEKIFNYIKDEGEFLPLAQCKTYIEMLQTKLKKTNLTDDEIKKAADLFIQKKREH